MRLYGNLLVSSCLTLVLADFIPDFPPDIAILCDASDPHYVNASRPFNLRFNFQPKCIAYPTLEQVSATVVAGVKNSMTIAARSGGHSYIANGLGGKNGALVVDLKNITTLKYDEKTGIATVGTGNRNGNIGQGLTARGRDVAHGSCPYVGIGGHASYGGFGFTSRMWGLVLDNIIAMDVIVANGTNLYVSEYTNADLFWAMKGAGGSFGIATQMYFQTFPLPKDNVTYFSYKWTLNAENSAQVLFAFQSWSLHSNVPKELGIEHAMRFGSQQETLTIIVTGSWYGAPADFANVINPLLAHYPSNCSQDVRVVSYLENLIIQTYSGTLDTSKPDKPDSFYAKSLVVPEDHPMSFDAISKLTDVLVKNGSSDRIRWLVAFELWGGNQSAINSVPRNATSFVHRSSLFVAQFYASCLNAKTSCVNGTNYPQEGLQFLDDAVQSITDEMGIAWNWGAYTNYIDSTLTKTSNWATRYYVENYPRLQKLKEMWDPHSVMGNFPSGIEPKGPHTLPFFDQIRTIFSV